MCIVIGRNYLLPPLSDSHTVHAFPKCSDQSPARKEHEKMADRVQKASSAVAGDQRRAEKEMGGNIVIKAYLIAYNVSQMLGYV